MITKNNLTQFNSISYIARFKTYYDSSFVRYLSILLESLLLGFLICLPLFFDNYSWVISLISLSVFFYRLEIFTNNKRQFYIYYLFFNLAWFITCSHHLFIGLLIGAKASLWMSLFGLSIPGIYCLSFSILLALIWRALANQTLALRLLGFISCWALFEWARLWLFTGYTIFSLGYFNTQNWLSGYAPLGGNLLVSISALTLSLVIAFSLHQKLSKTQGSLACLSIFLCGYLSYSYPWSQALKENPIKVALIQTGQSLHSRYVTITPPEMTSRTEKWLQHIDKDTDVIITPEGYLGQFISFYPEEFFQLLTDWAKNNNAGIILGSSKQIGRFLEHGYYHFISMFISNQELSASSSWWQEAKLIYKKRDLIPFTEFTPSWAHPLIDMPWFPYSDAEIGDRKKVIWQVKPNFWVAPSICYEFYYGNNIQANAVGANLLVNQAYQSWFEQSYGPEILQRVSRMRALEAAKPVVRVDSYGISSLISPKGEDILILPQGTETTVQTQVTGYQGETLYYRYSFALVLVLFILCWGLQLFRLKQNTKSGNTPI